MSLRSDDETRPQTTTTDRCENRFSSTSSPASGLSTRVTTPPSLLASHLLPSTPMSTEPSPSPDPSNPFYNDVLSGLTKTPKSIPSKYLYDDRGSKLFNKICKLPEYYVTNTEKQLTREYIDDIAAHTGSHARLVELGAGRGDKGRLLLDHLHDVAAYVPIDISPEELERCIQRVRDQFPDIDATAVCTDYTGDWTLPQNGFEGRTLLYYPGSTIGNFTPETARRFMDRLSQRAGPRGAMVIGVDLDKDRSILEAAYNDSSGVTAEFNLNLLRRINRECDANFDIDSFRHRAVFQPERHRIEMQLVSTCDQIVEFPDQTVEFQESEKLVTEHSYKYTIEDFANLCEEAGWRPRSIWTDDDRLFSLWFLENTPVE